MLSRFSPVTLALLRIFGAFMFFQLGAQKVFGLFGGDPPVPFTLVWFVGIAELLGSAALATGWLTRPFAVILAIDMIGVYLVYHASQGTFLPISRNRVTEEVAQLLVIAAFLVFSGPEKFSIEGILKKTREQPLSKYYPSALAFFRISIGLMYTSHGLQKLFGIGGGPEELFTLRWFGGFLECFGGLAITFGFLTAPVAFVLCGEMAVAYFMSHNTRGFWPLENNGIRAVLFCYMFLFLVTAGPGRFSLDGRFWNKGRAGARHPMGV